MKMIVMSVMVVIVLVVVGTKNVCLLDVSRASVSQSQQSGCHHVIYHILGWQTGPT